MCWSFAAQAQQTPFGLFYSGGQQLPVSGYDLSPFAEDREVYRNYMGLAWSDGSVYGAVELEYADGLNASRTTARDQSIESSTTVSFLAGVHAAENLVVFGRVGMQRARLSSAFGSSASGGMTDGMRFGIGADYSLQDHLRFRAEMGRSALRGSGIDGAEDMELRLALIRAF